MAAAFFNSRIIHGKFDAVTAVRWNSSVVRTLDWWSKCTCSNLRVSAFRNRFENLFFKNGCSIYFSSFPLGTLSSERRIIHLNQLFSAYELSHPTRERGGELLDFSTRNKSILDWLAHQLNETYLITRTHLCLRYGIVSSFNGLSTFFWRCPWCSRYRRRIWTRRHEFKSWTRLIAFHIALIPLGKVWIQLFSLQLWVNSRTD